MTTPATDRDRIDGLLDALERHASGTLRAVAEIREELTRREAVSEQRITEELAPAPAPVSDETRARAAALLARMNESDARIAAMPTAYEGRDTLRGLGTVVYFIQAEGCGPIKIGTTDALDRRLAALQIGSPVILRLAAVMRGGKAEEAELHERFAHLRLHGEWFEPGPDLVDYVDLVSAVRRGWIEAIEGDR